MTWGRYGCMFKPSWPDTWAASKSIDTWNLLHELWNSQVILMCRKVGQLLVWWWRDQERPLREMISNNNLTVEAPFITEKAFQGEGAVPPKAGMGDTLSWRKNLVFMEHRIHSERWYYCGRRSSGHVGPRMACRGFYPVGNETPLKNFMKGIDTWSSLCLRKATHRMYWQDLRLGTEICWQPVSRLLKQPNRKKLWLKCSR